VEKTLFEASGLSKSFNGQKVLDSVSLRINRGDSIVIIGQSGGGKSVLLKHLMLLMEPDEGTVIFDGIDTSELKSFEKAQLRKRMGMLFQSAALFDSMTVGENVGLALKESRKFSQSEIDDIVLEKLEMVGLKDAGRKFPSELSGGMRKRAGLARAIASNPEVVLYDEPTTGLDPITGDLINELIVELSEKLKITSVAVTHDMASAYKIADRIMMLYDGKIYFEGSPQEIRETDDAIVRQFITGSSHGPIQVG
jgi:phospholipid/cholesterol/gamma-HCH transport system ATP-binding protein